MSRVFCFSVWLAVLVFVVACTGIHATSVPDIPDGAEKVTRVEANGDRITEYHLGGQLRMIHVIPARGPAYYLYDRGGKPGSSADNPPQTYFKLFGW